jgi:RNA polymerase sigma factor (sigma-70 family)
MRARDRLGDVELLQVAASDPEAFAEFYHRYSHPIFAYFMQRLRRADLAADLTGETFAAAFERCRDGSPGRQPVPWLYAIAHHKLVDSLRQRRVDDQARRRLGIAPIELSDDELDRTEALVDLEHERGRLAQLLDALPPDERAALHARVIDEQDYVELAATLECSEAVVRKRVSRGLGRLRAAAKESG